MSNPHAAAPILFVDHATALGGAEYALLTLLETLDRTWLTPHLATPAGELADAARGLGVPVHELPLDRLRNHPLATWRLARGLMALRRHIEREAIVLVHANTLRAGIYAGLAARLTRRPFVWHVHDILPPGGYTRVLCRLADAVIAVSAAAANPLSGSTTMRIIHNGVDADAFRVDRHEDAARLRAQWGVPSHAILIGQVARLQPWKGQRDVIAAAAMLLQQRDDVYVAIVGGDIFGDAQAYEAELKATVQTQGLAARVIFTGQRNDVPVVLSALDVVVHASDREPFGRILIEAGAAGRPVVAYASGAVEEIVRHEQTGLLVPPGDRAALTAALRRLIDDRILARTLGDAARADVAVRFDARERTREIEAVYRSLIWTSHDEPTHSANANPPRSPLGKGGRSAVSPCQGGTTGGFWNGGS